MYIAAHLREGICDDRCRSRDARGGCLCAIAADEIERLRAALKSIADIEPFIGGDAWHMRQIARAALTAA